MFIIKEGPQAHLTLEIRSDHTQVNTRLFLNSKVYFPTLKPNTMTTGGCLCGKVTYSFDGEPAVKVLTRSGSSYFSRTNLTH